MALEFDFRVIISISFLRQNSVKHVCTAPQPLHKYSMYTHMIEMIRMKPTFKVPFRSRVEASHFVLFGSLALFFPWGLNNVQLLRGSEPINLLEIPRQVREYILVIHVLN